MHYALLVMLVKHSNVEFESPVRRTQKSVGKSLTNFTKLIALQTETNSTDV